MVTPEEARKLSDLVLQVRDIYKHADGLSDALRDLATQVESLQADAERYRYLRDAHPADETLWVAMGVPGSPAGVSCWRNEPLDAAIDEARKQS